MSLILADRGLVDGINQRLLSLAEMKSALLAFKKITANADVAVIYYAGFGMQSNNTNYLVPVDLEMDPDKIATGGLELRQLSIESIDVAHLVLLIDACFPGTTALELR